MKTPLAHRKAQGRGLPGFPSLPLQRVYHRVLRRNKSGSDGFQSSPNLLEFARDAQRAAPIKRTGSRPAFVACALSAVKEHFPENTQQASDRAGNACGADSYGIIRLP